MAEEGREQRMMEAEKKAAALPPKLTVPMILFFLPVLFLVVLGPAYIKYQRMSKQNESAPDLKKGQEDSKRADIEPLIPVRIIV